MVGIFTDEESGDLCALQAVGEIFEVVEVQGATPEGGPGSVTDAKFLFIGLHLDKARLEKAVLG